MLWGKREREREREKEGWVQIERMVEKGLTALAKLKRGSGTFGLLIGNGAPVACA
jgi:hypothetical protein